MKRIVFVGECMVEMAPADGGLYRMGFAGDTFNMAWYLARLRPDWRVDYLTDVGSDAVSDDMIAAIAAARIGTEHIRRHDDATVGLYLTSLHEGERSFAYWRGQSAARRLADDETRLAAAMARAEAVVLSGITLAIQPSEGRNWLISALSRARQDGAKVCLDPNLRPALWADAAEMRAALMAAAAVSDVVWPSFSDEAAAFGDADPAATLERYRKAGAREVIVKNGGEPVLFHDGTTTGSVTPVPVAKMVDSTAAGDAFNAGWLAARLARKSCEAAATQGCALSAKVIAGRGALVPV
ncbi:2-dehydro-3-deoxygluconokinase [Jannaschia seosinensis]|uniref:2-dehydro-3-deoxygluconokinase n=1 Tax=Jannaschia seosinensis TaxID=313367 RepID=A0A0M7BAH3_9RHOB|nr:sugar kinase [Jannaschia seosinensis]CUH38933.1 2-dehydro-3-deoxygluconokinase [Jannaschia seosinensis]